MIAELERPYRQVRDSLVPRDELFSVLTNAELAFSPGGGNPLLGELCVSLGETAHTYAESFRTFKADFSYRCEDRTLARNVGRLRVWHGEQDAALAAALSQLTAADATRTIARDGERIPLAEHLLVYNEALLLFYGKVYVYLRAMGTNLPNKWGDWVR